MAKTNFREKLYTFIFNENQFFRIWPDENGLCAHFWRQQRIELVRHSMRHILLLFSFKYFMFTNNIVTISPFNNSGVIDVVCPLDFKAWGDLIKKIFCKIVYFHRQKVFISSELIIANFTSCTVSNNFRCS